MSTKKEPETALILLPEPPESPPPPPRQRDAGPVITTLRILGGALIDAPCYREHRQARNWMAKIQPNAEAPGGWERSFAKNGRGDAMLYIVSDVFPGDVLEFGADYTTSVGRKYPERKYTLVVERTETALKVVVFDDPVDAWTARDYIRTAREPVAPPPPVVPVTDTIKELKELSRRLDALLDDPHPGLSTWASFLKKVCKEIGEVGERA